MNSEKINSWISMIANLGVLIGVIVLAYEINQNTRVIEVSAYQELVSMSNLRNEMRATDGELAEILNRAYNEQELTPVEQDRFQAFYRIISRGGDVAWNQFQNGLIDERLFRMSLPPMRGILNTKLGKQFWASQRVIWDPEFVEYVTNFMAQSQPDHEFWKE